MHKNCEIFKFYYLINSKVNHISFLYVNNKKQFPLIFVNLNLNISHLKSYYDLIIYNFYN